MLKLLISAGTYSFLFQKHEALHPGVHKTLLENMTISLNTAIALNVIGTYFEFDTYLG